MGLNFIIEKIDHKVLDTVVCDRCGTEIKKVSTGQWNSFGEPYSIYQPHFEDFFLLRTTWGYFSRKDGESHEAVICETCYDQIFSGVNIKIKN